MSRVVEMAKFLKTLMNLLVGTENDLVSADSIGLSQKAISKALKQFPSKALTERELIQSESEIGATLFGPVSSGGRREFFNLDPSTWIYYDEWNEGSAGKKTLTLRYEVHHNGILKVKEGARYEFIHGEELENFMTATQEYYRQVSEKVYQKPVSA